MPRLAPSVLMFVVSKCAVSTIPRAIAVVVDASSLQVRTIIIKDTVVAAIPTSISRSIRTSLRAMAMTTSMRAVGAVITMALEVAVEGRRVEGTQSVLEADRPRMATVMDMDTRLLLLWRRRPPLGRSWWLGLRVTTAHLHVIW